MHEGEGAENLCDWIRAAAHARGSAPCRTVPGRGTRSCADLLADIERTAARLKALDVQAGDRVLVQVEKSPEALLLYLACLRCRAVFVPLNTAYTPAEAGYFAGDCTPRLIVCDPAREAEFAAIAAASSGGGVATLDAQAGDHSWSTPQGRRSARARPAPVWTSSR